MEILYYNITFVLSIIQITLDTYSTYNNEYLSLVDLDCDYYNNHNSLKKLNMLIYVQKFEILRKLYQVIN